MALLVELEPGVWVAPHLAKKNEKKIKKAVKMLRHHMEWHGRLNPAAITQEDVATSLPQGCWRFAGLSKDGHPIIWINFSIKKHAY